LGRAAAYPLTDDEERRYAALVEQAAGVPGLFERSRAERAETKKLEALQAAERRLPMAESLVAACMAEQDLFDGLRRRLRPDARVVDLAAARRHETLVNVRCPSCGVVRV
jgi:hypothetical protein